MKSRAREIQNQIENIQSLHDIFFYKLNLFRLKNVWTGIVAR